VSAPGPGTAGRAGCVLAGLALLVAGLAGTAPAPAGTGDVTARAGPVTVTAGPLRPGAAGTLTTSVRVSTGAQPSDQLDAALAAGGAPVAVYHRQVSVGEIPDLAGCGGDTPPPGVVSEWLHYGPMLVPGLSGGPAPPAQATLTVRPASPVPAGRTLAITLYFARAGSVTLSLPVVSQPVTSQPVVS